MKLLESRWEKNEPISSCVQLCPQPDIFIPYEWLDFNQAGLRSWMEEGILWENPSPLELSLFWESLQLLCKSLLCFPKLCEAGHQVTLAQKVPRPACDITQLIPALPRSSVANLHTHPARTQQLWPPGAQHRGAGATSVNRTNNENSSKEAERALQMSRKLTNKQQRRF